MLHAFHHFVDGSIATRRDNQVRTIGDAARGNSAGRARPGSGRGDYMRVVEGTFRALETGELRASKSAGVGIVDDGNATIREDKLIMT